MINFFVFLVGETAQVVTLQANERDSNTFWKNAMKIMFYITQYPAGVHCVAGRTELTDSDREL